MVNHESFSRRILGAFITVAALTITVLIASYLGMRSLIAMTDGILSTNVADAVEVEALFRAHDRRTAELRAFLLSEDRARRREMDEARARFLGYLAVLQSRARNPRLAEMLSEARSREADYSAVIDQALRNRSRTNWILEYQAKPRRERLEETLTGLRAASQAELSDARATSSRAGTRLERLARVIGPGVLIFLLLMGLIVFQIVRNERAAVARSSAAHEVLHRARERAALLAETGRILSESADPKEALGQVASLAVKWLSQVFLIELTEGQDVLAPVAIATAQESQRAPLLMSLHQKLPKGIGSFFETHAILHSAGPRLQSQVTDPKLHALGVMSFIGVPLRARGRNLGVFVLARMEGAEAYGEQDVQFARELSHQTALAIDNARLLQEAEVGMRMREELLATVAHDLKTPLSVVRMTSEIGERDLAETTGFQARFETIREAAKEMNRLIHDLLELTQIEAGRVVLDRRPHDSFELIDACYRALLPQAAAKSIEIAREVRPGECIAECDRNRVLQVLSNLAGNAIKFTAPGGRIRIDAQATGDGIRFSVIDNGPGIPAEQLPYVFEKYWQARRAQQRGTGLGLSIARGLVEAHGGRIWAESALNIGSRFFFTLPEARVRAAPPAEAA